MGWQEEGWADKVMAEAMRTASFGVDVGLAGETAADLLEALSRQAKALKAVVYSPEKAKRVRCPACEQAFDVMLPAFEGLAKAISTTMKGFDELVRMTAFVEGKPDSRMAVSGEGTGVLAGLTDTQLAQVMSWLDENKRAAT